MCQFIGLMSEHELEKKNTMQHTALVHQEIMVPKFILKGNIRTTEI